MKKYIPTIFLLLQASPLHAIVNVGDIHLQEPETGFSAVIDLKLDGSGGNSDSRDFAIGSRLQWYQDGRTDLFLLDYSDKVANGSNYSREGLLHYRHIQSMASRWDREWFLQGEYKPFADLAVRQLAGVGLRHLLYYTPQKRRAYLGMSIMYVNETRLSDGHVEETLRGNVYFIAAWKISEDTSFSSSSYLQPALDNPLDLHILEQLSIKISVNKRTALVVNMDIRGDSAPAPGIKAWDTKYGTRIEYRL